MKVPMKLLANLAVDIATPNALDFDRGRIFFPPRAIQDLECRRHDEGLKRPLFAILDDGEKHGREKREHGEHLVSATIMKTFLKYSSDDAYHVISITPRFACGWTGFTCGWRPRVPDSQAGTNSRFACGWGSVITDSKAVTNSRFA